MEASPAKEEWKLRDFTAEFDAFVAELRRTDFWDDEVQEEELKNEYTKTNISILDFAEDVHRRLRLTL